MAARKPPRRSAAWPVGQVVDWLLREGRLDADPLGLIDALAGRLAAADVIHAVLWYSDLRDFTRLTETLPTAQLLAMLNEYFETVAAAVSARGGEILRFIGDAMLVVFPARAERDRELACRAAVEAALDAFARLVPVNRRRAAAAEPEIRFGVGLTAGEVVYGNVGAPDRLDFTVIGPSVNRAARLESLTKELGIPILMTAPFAACLERPVRSLGSHRLKGLDEPVEVWALETMVVSPENEHQGQGLPRRRV